MSKVLPLLAIVLLIAGCTKPKNPLKEDTIFLLSQTTGHSSIYFTYDKTHKTGVLEQVEFRQNGTLEELWKHLLNDSATDQIEVYNHDYQKTRKVDYYYSSTGQLQFIDVFKLTDKGEEFMYAYKFDFEGTTITKGNVADKNGDNYISEYSKYYVDENDVLLKVELYGLEDQLLQTTEYNYEAAIKNPLYGVVDFDHEFKPISKYHFTSAVIRDPSGKEINRLEVSRYKLNTAGLPEELEVTGKTGVPQKTVYHYAQG